MAADGVLNFNTKIDADGFVKGTKELSSKMVDLKNKISQTENEIAGLQKDLEKLENTKIKSKAMESLEKQVDKAKSKLNSLYAEADRISSAKAADLSSMGFDNKYIDDVLARDDSWQKIQKQIGEAEVALHRYERELKSAKAAESRTTGADTAEYAKKKQKLDELTGKLNVYKAKLNEAEAEEREASKQTGYTVEYFQKLAKALKETAAKLGKIAKANIANALKKTGSALKAITGHTRKTNAQMGLLEKSLNRIKQAIAGMLLYKILQGGLNSLKEGIDNLAKACPIANKNLSALVTSLTYLKNSLASAFSPILTVVTPILTKFMDTISAAANKVGQFIATLTGQSTYQQAIKVQQDYADSLDTSTKATEKNTQATAENQKNLAGYDELNVMQQEENSGSITVDSGAGEVTYFQTVPTIFSDFAEQLKQAFKKGDFTAIGQLVADKLNKAMSNIKWTKIRNTAKSWASNIAGFLNGAVEKLDWYLTGTTIGNGIMTAVDFGYTFLTKFDFLKFGKGLAKGLNGAIKSIDWRKLGNTLGGFVQSFISTGFGFVSKFDWKSFGKAISDGINGFFEKINWKQAGQAVSKGAKGAFSAISTALKNVNWKQIGKDIADFLTNIDWWGILESAGEAIWDALTGLLSFFSGISGKNNLSKTLGDLAKSFKELVKVAWDKLKSAYKNVLKPLADWIIDKAAPVILKALAEALDLMGDIVKKIDDRVLHAIAEGIGAVGTAIIIFKTGQAIANGITKVTNAIKGLITAISVHPLLAIASAIGGICLAVETYNELQWSNSEAKKFSDEIAIIKDEIETNTQGITDNLSKTLDTLDGIYADNTLIDDYQNKLEDLLSKAQLTPEEQSQLQTIVTYFRNNVDGFDDTWDEYVSISNNGEISLNGDLTKIQEEINNTIDSYQKLANASALSELSAENSKEQITANKKLAKSKLEVENAQKKLNDEEELLNIWLKKNGLTRGALENSADNDARYSKGKEYLDNIKSYKNDLDDLKAIYNNQIGAMNELIMTGDDLSDVYNVLNGDYSDAAAVMMAYNAGMINLEDVQKSQWQSLSKLESAAKDTGKNTVMGLVSGTEEYKGALITNSNGLANLVLSSYNKTMGIHSPSTEMYDRGVYTVQGLVNGIRDSFNLIKKAVGDAWNLITGIFANGTGFEQIKTAIWDVFKNALNGLIDGINNVIKQPFDAIDDALSGLRTWDFMGNKPFDWIPEINAPQIPKLATGAYVPANYGQFLAILGDNKREGELVAPESKFEQLIDRAMEKYGVNNTGGDIHLTINLDGEPVYKNVLKRSQADKKRHGVSPFV